MQSMIVGQLYQPIPNIESHLMSELHLMTESHLVTDMDIKYR